MSPEATMLYLQILKTIGKINRTEIYLERVIIRQHYEYFKRRQWESKVSLDTETNTTNVKIAQKKPQRKEPRVVMPKEVSLEVSELLDDKPALRSGEPRVVVPKEVSLEVSELLDDKTVQRELSELLDDKPVKSRKRKLFNIETEEQTPGRFPEQRRRLY